MDEGVGDENMFESEWEKAHGASPPIVDGHFAFALRAWRIASARGSGHPPKRGPAL